MYSSNQASSLQQLLLVCLSGLLFSCPGAVEVCPPGSVPSDGVCVPDEPPLPSGPPAAVDPGPPSFPNQIGTLSVSVRTADTLTSGTDSGVFSVCLTASDCFPLQLADVDDFRRGEVDVYHFEGLALPRSSVDRVELRAEGADNSWEPECLALAWDGEPVYCNDELGGEPLGGEAPSSWSDPNLVNKLCASCEQQLLTHGPLLGAMESESARVWVRTDATRQVSLRLSESAAMDEAAIVAWAYPGPTTDFTATLEAPGLQPATTYHYQVEVDGAPAGEPGTLQTAPASDTPAPLRFAFGSCAKFAVQPIFSHIADQNPDLFIFVGDNHYGNTGDRDSLRWNYRWSRALQWRNEFVASVPTLATWDDHDFTGNNTDGSDPGRESAARVFEEYWANPGYGTDEIPGIFSSYRWGQVDFFLLDDRYHRGNDGTLLGEAQTNWLLDALEASDARFHFLVSGSQWTGEGTGDSWAAFPEARTAFLAELHERGIEGVVLMSGDVHRSELRLLPRDLPGAYPLPELTSSPLSNGNSPCRESTEARACLDGSNYYVMVDVHPEAEAPYLTAGIYDLAGELQAEWSISEADLRTTSDPSEALAR